METPPPRPPPGGGGAGGGSGRAVTARATLVSPTRLDPDTALSDRPRDCAASKGG